MHLSQVYLVEKQIFQPLKLTFIFLFQRQSDIHHRKYNLQSGPSGCSSRRFLSIQNR